MQVDDADRVWLRVSVVQIDCRVVGDGLSDERRPDVARILLAILGAGPDDLARSRRSSRRDRPHVTGHKPTLAHDFVQPGTDSDRDVQRGHLPEERHGHDLVAGLAHETPHATAFAAEYERRRPPEIGRMPTLRA